MARGIFVLVFIVCLSSCNTTESESISLGTNIWLGYEPLYVAKDKGQFNDLDVRLVEYRSATQVMQGLSKGAINMAALTLDEAVLLREQCVDLQVIWVFDFSSGADGLVAQKQYSNIKALKGKVIGVETSALGQFMLHRILKLNHLSVADIKVKSLQADQHAEAFLSGEVDAVISFEPVLSKLIYEGGNLLFSTKEMDKDIVDVLVVQKDFFQNNAKQVDTFMKAYYQEFVKISNNINAYLPYLNSRMKMPIDDVEKMAKGIHIPSLKEQLSLFKDTEYIDNLINLYHQSHLHELEKSLHICECTELFNSSVLKVLNET